MTDEQRNYVKQAGTFQLRLQRVLYALREMDGAQRHIKNLQWSCPAEVNVKAGLELTREGLLDQAIRDVDDAIALTDLAVSGESEPEDPLEYDWPEDTVNLSPEAFGMIVKGHIAGAEKRHPFFAHETHNPHADYRSEAAGMQQSVEGQIEDGKVYADSLLLEEVYEFLAEVKDGNLVAAKAEAGDVAAVLYRMIKLMEGHA